MKTYTIDELNNKQIEELNKLEDEAYSYYRKIRAVKKFTEEVEAEE